MTLLIGAWTIGLILSLLALGVFISFRIFDFPDITTEGSITTGAAVAATLLVNGTDPFLATTAGFCSGALAGATTGVLHTKFKIHGLLAGILVMTALYSINLHIMGKSNVPLLSETTLATYAERIGTTLLGGAASLNVLGWEVSTRDAAILLLAFAGIVLVGWILYMFFRTNLGTAMRATGDNAQMIQALGANVGNMIIVGLALANGLIALSGALLAQYQGFADVQMGIGMVVWGLASVIIGEALIGTQGLGLTIMGAVMGSLLFRLLVAIALRAGLDPNDLKLITATFVFIALILPNLLDLDRLKKRRGRVTNA
jgi:putative ABC transport system permease protein